MKEKRISVIGAAVTVLVVLIIFFMARFSLHQPPEVILAKPNSFGSEDLVLSNNIVDQVLRVEVTPQNVQRVIEQIKQPDEYSRLVKLERYWQEGGETSNVYVQWVKDWVRMDITENHEEKHVIITPGKASSDEIEKKKRTYIWYGNSEDYFSAPAILSASEEQGIPSNEDILLLTSDDITYTDYRMMESVNCIYMETMPDDSGYKNHYWISVDSGLLIAAERTWNEKTIFRMSSSEIDTSTIPVEAFTLPDGTVLYDPTKQ